MKLTWNENILFLFLKVKKLELDLFKIKLIWTFASLKLRVWKESITSQKLASCDFWQIANSVLNNSKSAIPPLFSGPKVLSSASDKAKLCAENFCKNPNLDDTGISLPVFPSKTNLKLHNTSVTPKLVKKVIMNLDMSKASGADCISVVVLKNYEPEFSYKLAELFNKCLIESFFCRLLEGFITGPCI